MRKFIPVFILLVLFTTAPIDSADMIFSLSPTIWYNLPGRNVSKPIINWELSLKYDLERYVAGLSFGMYEFQSMTLYSYNEWNDEYRNGYIFDSSYIHLSFYRKFVFFDFIEVNPGIHSGVALYAYSGSELYKFEDGGYTKIYEAEELWDNLMKVFMNVGLNLLTRLRIPKTNLSLGCELCVNQTFSWERDDFSFHIYTFLGVDLLK